MATPTSDTERPFSERLRVLFRRRRIVLLTFVLVVAATAAFILHQQRLYTATAQVELSNQNLATALTNTVQFTGITVTPNYLAQTQADVARSPQLARLTVRAANLRETPAAFLARSTASPLSDADLLVFSVSDPTPRRAQLSAAAYAQQYVAFSQSIATAALVKARQQVQQAIVSNPGNKALHAQLVAKDQQLATIEALGNSTATVVSTGSAAVQSQPKTLRTMVVGAVVGLVLGIGLASLWDALDTRARSPEEIEELLGAPLLGGLPPPPRNTYDRGEIAMLADRGGVSAEAFRTLRTQVDLARMGSDCQTIMVISCAADEGKTTTVANLAVAMAAAGHRVVAVDLDLRDPQLHRFMAPDGTSGGVTDVALGELALDDALVRVPTSVDARSSRGRPGGEDDHSQMPDHAIEDHASSYASTAVDETLMFLPAGVTPPNPGEFSNSHALGLIIAELRDRFDTILIDAPPALAVGDALALSQGIDAILVVARVDVVRRPLLARLRRLLKATPATTIGVIVTGVRAQGRPYYGTAVRT